MTENSDIKPEDGSIETVLSSIRRILKEGKEAKPAAAPAAPPVTPPTAQPAAAQPTATQAAVPAPVQDRLVEENMDDPEDDEDSVLVLDSSMMATDDEDEHPEEPHAEEPHPEAGHGNAAHAAESHMENARPEHDHAGDAHAAAHHAEEEEDEPFLDEHEFHEAEAARQKHEAEHGTTAAGDAPPLVLDAAAPAPHHDATPALPAAAAAAAAAPAVTAPPAISAPAPVITAPETASASHAGAVETVQTPLQETAHTPGTPARKKWSVPTTLSGVTMSEDRDASETQNYPAGYTAGGAASDTDAPAPVQIPLDKQTIGATEHSFGALQQMLRRKQSVEHRERRVAITRGGNLTIEDIVRDEVRAFLKEWLDQHLSGIVQQAVQKEIERLSDR
ncbi:DUF2497 domain-containing protein [Acetobacter musti]|nr:DUF2497 domain-containing protein [Acetobacter musti]